LTNNDHYQTSAVSARHHSSSTTYLYTTVTHRFHLHVQNHKFHGGQLVHLSDHSFKVAVSHFMANLIVTKNTDAK
jgi:hypothetical protein